MTKNVRDILSDFSAAWPSGRKDFRTNEDDSWKKYALALRDVVQSGDRETILSALSDENRQVRALCARALGFLTSENAVPALARVLADDTWATARLMAADSLGMIGSDSTRAVLKGALAAEEDQDVSLHINIALSRSSSLEPKIVDQLLSINEALLDSAVIGNSAPEIKLSNGFGTQIALADYRSKRAVALFFLYGDG